MKGYIKIFLLIFSLFIIYGCDLLKTREPELPITQEQNWIIPASPDILISNFKTSIEQISTENYVKCFIDTNLLNKSYSFVPTPESMLIYKEVFSNWNILSERTYFLNLKSRIIPNTSPKIIFTNEKYSSIQNDSTSYTANYELTIEHNLTTTPKIFKGSIELILFRNLSGLWAIGKWSDYLSGNSAPWSNLKGSLSY